MYEVPELAMFEREAFAHRKDIVLQRHVIIHLRKEPVSVFESPSLVLILDLISRLLTNRDVVQSLRGVVIH